MSAPVWWRERDRALAVAERSERYRGVVALDGAERVVICGAGTLYAYQVWLDGTEFPASWTGWCEVWRAFHRHSLVMDRRGYVIVRSAALRDALAAVPDDPVEAFERLPGSARLAIETAGRPAVAGSLI